MRPTHRVVCGNTRRLKLVFATEEKALNFIKYNAEDIKQQNGYAPIRAYYCTSCGGWHVTSKPHRSRRKPDYSKPLVYRKLYDIGDLILQIVDIIDTDKPRACRMLNRASIKLNKVNMSLTGADTMKSGLSHSITNLQHQLYDKGECNREGQEASKS